MVKRKRPLSHMKATRNIDGKTWTQAGSVKSKKWVEYHKKEHAKEGLRQRAFKVGNEYVLYTRKK